MPEEIIPQNVEVDYINTMLKADDLSGSENEADVFDNENLYQLFSVSGFKIAVLSSDILASVSVGENEIVDNVLLHATGRFNIIDIGCLINPSYDSLKSRRFVLLKDEKLALTCEQVLEKEKIDKHAVCWRDEYSQRIWLAGTVKDKNIILLDVLSLQNKQFTDNR